MNKGISVLEILIVIAIIGVLLAVILFQFGSFRANQILTTEVEKVVTVLQDARSRTLASVDDSQYGVHIDIDETTLFKGTSYTEGAPANEEALIDSVLEIVNISLGGGGEEIVFEKLTGKTDNYGTFVIRTIADTSKLVTITVHSTGISSYSK